MPETKIPKANNKKSIEEILFDDGILDVDQLSAVKFENVNTGKSIEDIILEKNLVEPNDLIRAKGKLFDIPYVDIETENIDATVLEYVPEPIAKKLHIIPISLESGQLKIAMADPLDLQSIEFVERKSGKKVRPVIASAEAIDRVIFTEYGKSISQEVSQALEDVDGITEIKEQGVGDIQKEEKKP